MITSFFGLVGELIQKVSDHSFFIKVSNQVRPVAPDCLVSNVLGRVYLPLLLYLYLDGRQREAEPH